MKEMKCLVVDDERLARASLCASLEEYPGVEVVAEASSTREAIDAMREQKPDLLFLDVQMPGGSGFDLLEQLEDPPPVIFVTAYDKYAIRAFEVNALDYLLKPVDPDRLRLSLERVNPENEDGRTVKLDSLEAFRINDRVFLNSGQRCVMAAVSDVLYILAEGNYTRVCLANGNDFLVRFSMKIWQARLPETHFSLLSRSLLLQVRRIDGWETCDNRGRLVHFADSDRSIKLSRSAADRLRNCFE
jgi:two-component system LytT family response regulator